MKTILYICLISFIFGAAVTLFMSLRKGKNGIKIGGIGIIIMFLSLVVALIVAYIAIMRTSEPTRYFPESEYSLEYIVTECSGKIDTTYVIIPKE